MLQVDDGVQAVGSLQVMSVMAAQWYNRRALGKIINSLITLFPTAKLSKKEGTTFLSSKCMTNI